MAKSNDLQSDCHVSQMKDLNFNPHLEFSKAAFVTIQLKLTCNPHF